MQLSDIGIVNVLPDELGVQSAVGGDGLNDGERCDLLLEKLKEAEDRSAYFVCVLCFYLSPEEIFFEGGCNGSILQQKQGEAGFGYDPVFLPEGDQRVCRRL